MAKIAYSMCGEGRGHATRVRTLVEMMRQQHEFVLFAARDAYDFFCGMYDHLDNVSVRRIPGLYFAYNGDRVSYLRCLSRSVPFLRRLNHYVQFVTGVLEREQCDLAITDFEPILPRAARRVGLPLISFDHQHFLQCSDFSSLPWELRLKAFYVRLPVPWFYWWQKETIVSSFWHFPLRKRYQDVQQVGVMLRPEVLNARASDGDHLLVYLRRHGDKRLMQCLRECGRPVKVYGLHEPATDGNVTLCRIGDADFISDLASCCSLISNAGNQLLGEALYLRKPILAFPEPGNVEQTLNGCLLERTGWGRSMPMSKVTPATLRDFLTEFAQGGPPLESDKLVGNRRVLELIQRQLPDEVNAATGASWTS